MHLPALRQTRRSSALGQDFTKISNPLCGVTSGGPTRMASGVEEDMGTKFRCLKRRLGEESGDQSQRVADSPDGVPTAVAHRAVILAPANADQIRDRVRERLA